ncbi:MAG TPA: DUF3990 domain-containing protein [Longimicrobium sp.]
MEQQSRSRMLYPPARWRNPVIRLYHGTTADAAREIVQSGIAISRGRDERDFGRGFYTTTLQRQARNWAFEVARESGRTRSAAVVQLDLARESLASLATLMFVRGDFHAADYWSFVVHCRNGAVDHGRTSHADGLYDVVVGPIAAFWKQRAAMSDSDQISFHTEAAEAALNSSARVISWTASR